MRRQRTAVPIISGFGAAILGFTATMAGPAYAKGGHEQFDDAAQGKVTAGVLTDGTTDTNGGTTAYVVGLPVPVDEKVEPQTPLLASGQEYLLNAAGQQTPH